MIVVRLAGTKISNLYALVTADDWELGMPVGLAHWDGQKWRWLGKVKNYYFVGIGLVDSHVYLLDSGGSIFEHRSGRLSKTREVPSDDCRSLAVNRTHTILVTCGSGSVFRSCNGEWRRVDTNTLEDMYCAHEFMGKWVLAGSGGTLLRCDYDCEVIGNNSDEVFLTLDGADTVLFAGGTRSLVHIAPPDWQVISVPAPSPVYSVAARSDRDVYCATSNNGILCWNGVQFREVLSKDLLPGQIAKANNTILVGTSRGRMIYYDPPLWKTMEITLDEGYLMDQ